MTLNPGSGLSDFHNLRLNSSLFLFKSNAYPLSHIFSFSRNILFFMFKLHKQSGDFPSDGI